MILGKRPLFIIMEVVPNLGTTIQKGFLTIAPCSQLNLEINLRTTVIIDLCAQKEN